MSISQFTTSFNFFILQCYGTEELWSSRAKWRWGRWPLSCCTPSPSPRALAASPTSSVRLWTRSGLRRCVYIYMNKEYTYLSVYFLLYTLTIAACLGGLSDLFGSLMNALGASQVHTYILDPLSDQFPVRACSCSLCILTVCDWVVYIPVYLCVFLYASLYIYGCLYMHLYISMHLFVCVYMCVYMYIHTHIYIYSLRSLSDLFGSLMNARGASQVHS